MAGDQLKQALLERAKREKASRDKPSAFYENIVGHGEVDTPGERLGELIRGAGAATARGIVGVPGLLGDLYQMSAGAGENIGGAIRSALGKEPTQHTSLLSRAIDLVPNSQDTRGVLSAVTGGESDYVAPGLAGQFVSTAGEFTGGAGALSGPGAMIRYGVIPGVSSETAGQATEGMAVEPYARAGAGLAAALLASPKPGAFNGADENGRMANVLRDNGVRDVTVGQAKGSKSLMSAEGRLQATQNQIDDFTASTMRQLGSNKKLATPENLLNVEKTIVAQMDDAVKGVSVVPFAKHAKAANDVAKKYVERVPAGSLTPRVRGIANEMRNLAVKKRPVSLAQLKEWRSDIGKLTTSPDAATRESAHGLRQLIDEMTDGALTQAGRADDIAKLAAARESYRNYIAVRDAASRAGAEGGTLSPQALNQSLIRSQGRDAYATGRTTPMGDFTRSGASVLRPAATVSPGGIRSIAGAFPTAFAALMGGGALQAGLSPLLAGGLAASAAVTPELGRSIMRSNPVQQLMRGPGLLATQTLPVAPGLLGSALQGR